MQLIETVYRHTKGGSYKRLNHALQNALSLVVHAGFKFEPSDFCEISSRFRGGYWLTNDFSERLYSSACAVGNISAAISCETWLTRKPFILGGSRLYEGREIDRLLLGISREPGHPYANVTSFSAEGDAVNFYAHDGASKGKRLRLTYEQVRAAEKQRKDTAKAAKQPKEEQP